jgi:hypothetical protein
LEAHLRFSGLWLITVFDGPPTSSIIYRDQKSPLSHQLSSSGSLYQCPFKFGHGHEHPELELADRILLGRIDPLTRAEQSHVPNLQFPDNNGEVG